MAESTALRALILDYGNVLTHVQQDHWFEGMAAELGAPGDRFRDAYWGHRHAYDAGLSAHDYWRRVAEAVGRPVGDVPRPMIDRLIDMDVSSWAEYRDEVWNLARSFRTGGGRTAFLSNGVPETMSRLRAERALDGWFDVVVVSYEVGLAKPDPGIFELCLSRLGVHAGEALFVDDRAENVAAAERLGMRTLHFTGEDATARLMDTVRSLTAP
jgi:putative hydrolase of the HAD superfamily